MDYVVVMTVNHCGEDLLHGSCGFLLGEKVLLDDSFKEFSASAQFCYYVKVLFILKEFIDLQYIRMVQRGQYIYLIYQSCLIFLPDLRFWNSFNCSPQSRTFVLSLSNFAISSLPNNLMADFIFLCYIAELLTYKISLVNYQIFQPINFPCIFYKLNTFASFLPSPNVRTVLV